MKEIYFKDVEEKKNFIPLTYINKFQLIVDLLFIKSCSTISTFLRRKEEITTLPFFIHTILLDRTFTRSYFYFIRI